MGNLYADSNLHVHYSLSYQQAIYQKYDQRGHELPSGYGPLTTRIYRQGSSYSAYGHKRLLNCN